jgi:DinB superfamily
MLTAFGETPEQILAELNRAFDRTEASILEQQDHWLQQPAEGRWSPAQVTEHVLIVNEGVAGIVKLLLSDKPLRPGSGTPGEMVGGKRVAPAGLEPGEGSEWAALQARWNDSRAALMALGEQAQGADLSRRFFHPFLGDIDVHDWLRMATYHTRHHRRQLEERLPAGA